MGGRVGAVLVKDSVEEAKSRNYNRETFPRADQRPWTSREIGDLRRLANLGAQAVADQLGRSVHSVKMQAHRMRISLRRPGEQSGLILGQPRGVAILRATATRVRSLYALREDVLAGRVDIARIERRVRLLARGAPLCPGCGLRPQEIERTGLCEDCHVRGLARAHRLEPDNADAHRELDRERQRKHRRKGRKEEKP